MYKEEATLAINEEAEERRGGSFASKKKGFVTKRCSPRRALPSRGLLPSYRAEPGAGGGGVRKTARRRAQSCIGRNRSEKKSI